MAQKKSIVLSLVVSFEFLAFLCALNFIELPHVASSVETNSHCESQDDCGDFMMCLDNECVCDEDTETATYPEGEESSLNHAELCGRQKCDNSTNICSANSYCSPEGFCKCLERYEEEKHSRKCKLPHGSQCASTDACNTDKFLSCIKGSCRCHNEDDTAFDRIRNTCVGRLAASCDLHVWMGLQLGCGHNAECSKVSPNSQVNAYEGYGVCHCSSGFVPNKKSQGAHPHSCVPTRGSQCNSLADCGDYANLNLDCLKNQCVCRSGSVYDEKGNACRLLVGSKCTDKKGGNCVDNATCKEFNYPLPQGESMCTCDEGFTPNSNKTCSLSLSHGESCTNTNISCDSTAGLFCKDDLCECKDNFEFDYETQTCIASSCSLSSTNGSSCSASYSECNDDLLKCQCIPGFVHDVRTGRCTQLLGRECSTSPTAQSFSCDGDHHDGRYGMGLKCLRRRDGLDGNEVCGCDEENGEIFDEEARKCLLRVGESCALPNRPCVTNAFCGTGNKCQCYTGFDANSEKNCLLTFGEPCGISRSWGKYKKCGSGGLMCLNGTCDCTKGKKFDRSTLNCENITSISINETSNVSVDNNNKYRSSVANLQISRNEETSTILTIVPPAIRTTSNSLIVALFLSVSLAGVIFVTFIAFTISKKYRKFKLLRQTNCTESHRVQLQDDYVLST